MTQVTLVKDYVDSHVSGALPTELLQYLHENLRYRPEGYERTWAFKNGKSDGYIYLFDIMAKKFRTGLLDRVHHILTKAGVECKVVDVREKRDTVVSDLAKIVDVRKLGMTPFEYQEEAGQTTVLHDYSVIASPTGTGKTLMMAEMIRMHSKRTLIVVNSRVLLDQAYEFFDQLAPGRVGIVGSGDFELNDITIATIQTIGSICGLNKKETPTAKFGEFKDWYDNVGQVIHDEVHEADSDTVDGFYGMVKSDSFVGMTATPYSWAFAREKHENLEMEQHFGVKNFDSRDKVDFIKLGITVPLMIRRVATPVVAQYEAYSKKKYNPRGMDYKVVVDDQVINNEERIELIAKTIVPAIVNSGQSCYVYYQRIKYGEKLCEALGDFDPVLLRGETPREERKKCFSDLDSKKKLVAVSDIGSYGLNIKSLDSIVLSYPQKDARQLKGRVCRAAPGKKFGFVYDLTDNVPFLSTHADMREKQYINDEDTVIG